MKWNEILIFWFFVQVGNWLSYFILDTRLETSLSNMFFSGFFAIGLAVMAVVITKDNQ